MACAGGFPEALLLKGRVRKRWHTDYIDAILEHDLADITQIHRRDQMQELIRVLAAWSSKFMNVTRIGSSLSLRKQALQVYINALAAQVDVSNDLYTLWHYRDRQNREIDFLIEREDGAMIGIEVKSGSNIGMNDFRHMKWFKETLVMDRPFSGIILYSGENVASFGENMLAVPFGALWS